MRKNASGNKGKQQLISSYFTKVPESLNIDNNESSTPPPLEPYEIECEVEILDGSPSSDSKKQEQVAQFFYKSVDSEEEFADSGLHIGKSPKNNKRKVNAERDNISAKKFKDFGGKSAGIIIRPPEKLTPQKKNKTPRKSPFKTTPRKTPKKLFLKSPDKIQEFQVEVLENFIVVTPSKLSEKCKMSSPKKTGGSGQKVNSLLNSNIDFDEEGENNQSSTSKAKLKLDFTNPVDRSPLQEIPQQDVQNKETNLPKMHKDLNENCDKSLINLEGLLSDSWDDSEFTEFKEDEYILDLSATNYCRVISILQENRCLILTLQSTENEDKAKCVLRDFWVNCAFEIGCKIYVEAEKVNGEWTVSRDAGLVVFEPDYLIACTTLSNFTFCKRRTILQQRFKFEGGNKYMAVGLLVHELLERVLKANTKSAKVIEHLANRLLTSRDTLQMLYSCSEDLSFVQSELRAYIPKISEFMNTYVKPGKKPLKSNWQGSIDTVEDIEENIWCPKLGIKGKIDVTIRTNNRVMPLELKTGRSTMSLEHRTQMLLYIMMMNKSGYDVSSSLLLYLKEGVIKEFPYNDRVKSDITMLRNELAYYLTRKVTFLKADNGDIATIKPPLLPEPIDNQRACSKCDFNVICATYSRYEDQELPSNFRTLSGEVLHYLRESHLDYFVNWIGLLHLESSHESGSKDVKEIYTVAPKEREKNLQCLADMVLANSCESSGIFKHTFCKKDAENPSLSQSSICDHNFVVISTDTKPAIAFGIVQHKDSKTITVTIDRDLMSRYSKSVFHLDTYESKSSDVFNMSNLALLLEQTDKAGKLRSLIIDKKQPSFESTLPKEVTLKCVSILKNLNRDQKSAILKTLMAKDYLLIKGMPGTGKTATIVALIECLVKLDKSVLITGHTHSSVDTVCRRLVRKGVKFLRLGSQARIHKDVAKFSEVVLTEKCETVQELDEIYQKAPVFAVTCLGSNHVALAKKTFDYCIVDESTQVIQPSILRGLLSAKIFVLIGDPDQLEPVVRNTNAAENGLAESLFERLCSAQSSVSLTLNYRMNRTITHAANSLTYQGELKIADELTENATLTLTHLELKALYEKQPWIIEALDTSLEAAICIIDTGPVWSRLKMNNIFIENEESYRCTNLYEISAAERLVEALIEGGLNASKIGVISPYKAQVSKLSASLKRHSVETSTVDQFQGKDKDVIIYSCTRSNDSSKPNPNIKNEILENKRRLTVALTRAKVKFILIGDLLSIKKYTPFAQLLATILDKHVIDISRPQSGFDWSCV